MTNKQCVARGIKELDKSKPNWWKKIKVTKLDIDDVHDCVLGHVFGRYGLGIRALKLDWMGAGDYGFAGGGDEVRQLWIEEVRKRKKLAAA